MRLYVQVTGAVFALGALAQAARAVLALPIDVAGFHIPLWASAVACVVAVALAAWAFRLVSAARA